MVAAMTAVYLVGGTNHGRVVTVLHGSSVCVPQLTSPPAMFDTTLDYGAATYKTETYARPDVPVVINSVERWLLVKPKTPRTA